MKRGGSLKRTELRRRTPLRSSSQLRSSTPLPGSSVLRTGSKVKPVSERRTSEGRTYKRLRRCYLAANPTCEFPLGCVAASTEIQHKAGRVGRRYLYVGWWAASCHYHNTTWVEQNKRLAHDIGWELPRDVPVPGEAA